MEGIIGSTIRGQYLVESEIGSGGMGVVYRAKDKNTGEDYAIKIISPKALAEPDRQLRFRNEAKVAASLRHDNIVRIYDVGFEEIAGQMRDYIIMEYVSGRTLAERIGGQPMPVAEALGLGIQILAALQAAHQAGITHRDIKPSNIIVSHSGVVKLLDFGLAKLNERPADPYAETGSVQMELTHEGTIIGTVAYMSPEQARSLEVDPRSDIFSFGAVFYEMLSGKPAFTGATTADRLTAVLTNEPEDLTFIPLELVAIVMRCLRKDADRRWQTAGELLSALEDIRRGGNRTGTQTILLRTTSNRRAFLAAVGGLAAGLIPAIYYGTRQPPRATYQRLTFRNGDITGARFAPSNLIAYTAAWDGEPSMLFTCLPGNREARKVDVPAGRLMGVTQNNEVAIIFENDELNTVSLGGGLPRPRRENVTQACWGPDGTTLAVIVAKPRGVFETEYPLGKKVHESPQRKPESLRVSPSGDDLAFFEFVPDVGDYQVVVVNKSGASRILSTGWRSFGSLVWTPDGKEIWLTGVRGRADPMIYALSMNGSERVVGQSPEWLYLHDFDANRRLLVAQTISRLNMHFGGTGIAGLKSLSHLGSSNVYDISADGKYLLFVELAYGEGRNPAIYLGDLKGLPPRMIGEGNRPALSPDGRKVVCIQRNRTQSTIAILPNGPGDGTTLNTPEWSFEAAGWMPDSARLLVYGAKKGAQPATFVVDSQTGAVIQQVTAPGIRAIQASPDGQQCAGIADGQVRVFSTTQTSGGRGLTAAKMDESVIRWGSKGIYTSAYEDSDGWIDLVEPAGGRRSRSHTFRLQEPGAAFADPPVVSPDGATYAFTYQRDVSSLHLATGFA
ncbi:hypothetical protein F183_A45050 [Bryobacterales bacterium F-183]|nr:hypothetical protein F183_A45050 [Bryobacterales bacterium F-183]